MNSRQVIEYPVEEEYKKNPDISPEDVAKIRQWIKTQPHLPAEHISDLDIILTYHCCGLSAEVTKQVLDLNLTLRTHLESFFSQRTIEVAERSLNTLLITPLSTRSKKGYTCVYTRLLDCSLKKFVLVDITKTLIMVLDLLQHEEGTWPGVMFFFDFAGVTLPHLALFDISTVQQFFYYLQEAMLVNLKGLHVLNAPSYIDKFVAMARPFMKKELISMLHIHQAGSQKLEEFYPVSALPFNCGDSNYLLRCKDMMVSKLKANKAFFERDIHKRVVESKRPGKPKTITDYFGSVEGSFKKLNFD